MNGVKLLKKVPWKGVLKVGGIIMVGVSSVMSAYDGDEKTQAMIKKVAEKYMSFVENQES